LARLDKPEDAQEVLASALASLDPEAMKTRPRLLTALATAHVRQGNMPLDPTAVREARQSAGVETQVPTEQGHPSLPCPLGSGES
jgi:hypothetical protein